MSDLSITQVVIALYGLRLGPPLDVGVYHLHGSPGTDFGELQSDETILQLTFIVSQYPAKEVCSECMTLFGAFEHILTSLRSFDASHQESGSESVYSSDRPSVFPPSRYNTPANGQI
jgi:hypothetical protein